MSYNYRISWGWYEEYAPFEFQSENHYDENELEQIVIDAIEKALPELLKDDAWIGNSDLIEGAINHLPPDFKKVVYASSYHLWGSNIIKRNDEEYIGKIPSKILDSIYEHNDAVGKKFRL